MKIPKRRSLATSVRVALTSGLAAPGWLLLGSTSAHATEEAAPIADAVIGAVDEIVTTPVAGAVDEVLGTTPVVGGFVPEGTVSTVTDTTPDVVQDPAWILTNPVGAVETVTTPVTDVLAPVTEVLAPIGDAVNEVIGTTPVVGEIFPPVTSRPVSHRWLPRCHSPTPRPRPRRSRRRPLRCMTLPRGSAWTAPPCRTTRRPLPVLPPRRPLSASRHPLPVRLTLLVRPREPPLPTPSRPPFPPVPVGGKRSRGRRRLGRDECCGGHCPG